MRTEKCPQCDRMFKDEHGVKQHLADVHGTGKRPRAPERYPLNLGAADADLEGEYEPRQFAVGARDDDF